MVNSSRFTFLFYAGGIFVCYFFFGLLQEKVTKTKYGESGDRFTFTLALVAVQCVINLIFSQVALMLTRQGSSDKTPRKVFIPMALTYLGAMLASNHALQHVSYPTQVIGKSIKPIPVMILGVLIGRKSYSLLKYLFVMMIVVGVALFMYNPRATHDKADAGGSIIGFGEILLLLSLALDGLTAGQQDRLRGEHKTAPHTMMLYLNLGSVVYLAAPLVFSGELFRFLEFCGKHPNVWLDLLMFSFASAAGQHFIFVTITSFGPLSCSIVTTTRKFFTVLASIIIFQHPISSIQWLGTIFVFAGLLLDQLYGGTKKHGKPVA